MRRFLQRAVKPAVFFACLLPAVWMTWRGLHGALGANPVEALTHGTGDWALRLLLLTLAVTPLRRLSGWNWPLRLRRMLGLYAFGYALAHVVTYLWLDQFFDWGAILNDIVKRPFITVGLGAFLILVPLAATSTRAMMRRLGRRWGRLHRGIYLASVLGVLHFWWLVKVDIREPALYAGVLAVLLAARLPGMGRRRRAGGPGRPQPLGPAGRCVPSRAADAKRPPAPAVLYSRRLL